MYAALVGAGGISSPTELEKDSRKSHHEDEALNTRMNPAPIPGIGSFTAGLTLGRFAGTFTREDRTRSILDLGFS